MTRRISPNPDDGEAGSAPALDVFALRDSVVEEYKRFATSFTIIHAPDIRGQVEAIYAGNRYWPEPLIQINPSYKRSTDVGTLVADGVIDPGCADIFRADDEPLSLYEHQKQALALAADGESFVVTTGTGSGEVALLLHPHRQPRAGRTACERRAAHARHRRLPDERARQLPGGRADQVHRPGARRAASHFRPLHRAGRRERAEANCGQPPRHPPHQLHDAGAPDDAAGGDRPPRHRQLCGASLPGPGRAAHVPRPPGCGRGAARAPGPRAAPAREAPVHRHLGDDGERGSPRGQEPRGRGRGVEALRDPCRREQRRHRDARTHHRSGRHRRVGQGRPSAKPSIPEYRRTSPTRRSGSTRWRCGWRRGSASRSPTSTSAGSGPGPGR